MCKNVKPFGFYWKIYALKIKNQIKFYLNGYIPCKLYSFKTISG